MKNLREGTILLFRPVAEPVTTSKVERKECWIPYSILTIAGPALDAGFKVVLYDGYFDEDYEAILEKHKDDLALVGVTTLTGYQITDGLKFAKMVRERHPEIPLIWGGYHPSLYPEQTAEHPLVDVVVCGQGEVTFVELLKALRDGGDLSKVKGLAYREKATGKVLKTPGRELHDLNEFRYRFDLLPMMRYTSERYPEIGKRMVSYFSSYGCPYKCGFCAEPQVTNRRWKSLVGKRVVDDLAELNRLTGADAIYFADSNFFVKKDRVREICEELKARKLPMTWFANARADQLIRYGDDMWQLMKDSGLRQMLVGAESGSDEILDFITKDSTVEDHVKFLEKAKQYGIIAEFSLIVGFPNAPVDDFKANVDYVGKIMEYSRENKVLLYIYTPYPGTALFQKAIDAGLEVPKSFEGWSNYSLRQINTPWLRGNFAKRYEFFQRVHHYVWIDKLKEDYRKKGRSMFSYHLNRALAKARWKTKFFGLRVETLPARLRGGIRVERAAEKVHEVAMAGEEEPC